MTLTAVLMAGGESRRMGRDKALLNFNGRPLWERQLTLLRELQPQTILVSARARPDWCPPHVEVVLDVPPSRGPLSGLAAALSRVRTTHLLALGIDLPLMTSKLLRRLWRAAGPGCGVVCWGDHGFEGLCAIYPAEAAPFASAALGSPDASLQNFLHALSREKLLTRVLLDPFEIPLFRNVNTPADLPVAKTDRIPGASRSRRSATEF